VQLAKAMMIRIVQLDSNKHGEMSEIFEKLLYLEYEIKRPAGEHEVSLPVDRLLFPLVPLLIPC
jgi:hypothetical protein